MNGLAQGFGPGARFFIWMACLGELLLGIAMLVSPAQFERGQDIASQSSLLLCGLLAVTSGAAVAACQLVPSRQCWLPQVSLLVAALTFLLLARDPLDARGWLGASTYTVLAAALVLSALHASIWLESRLRVDFPSSIVAVDLLSYGALLLLLPHPLPASSLAVVRPYLVPGALAMLAAGALLVAAQIPSLHARRQRLALAAAALTLGWTYVLGVRAHLPGMVISFGILTIGIAVRPCVPDSWLAPPRPRLANKLVAAFALWSLLVTLPEAAVLARATHAGEELVAVLASTLLLSGLAGALIGRRLTRPLVELVSAARQLEGGRQPALLIAPEDEEVGDLARAFAGMQARLESHARERERAEVERGPLRAREQVARAEVEALLAATASMSLQAEPEAVLRTLVEQAASLLQADRALYAVVRAQQLVIPWYWERGRWIEDGHEARRHGLLWATFESGQPFRSNDLQSEPNADAAIVARHKLDSQLSVPLIGPDGERLGLISLNNSRRAGGFSAHDERLLVAICETGAATLLRARDSLVRLEAERVAAQRKQEVELLLTAADRLNGAAEPEHVLLQVVEIATEMLAVAGGDIATNEGDHVLRHHLWVDGAWHSVEMQLPLDASLSGWVIRHARPCRSNNLRRGPQVYLPAGLGAPPRTAMAVPILGRDGHVFGALSLYDRRDAQPFTEDDERLAEGIAHHAAVALERATLIQELRHREERLRSQAVTDPLTGLPNRAHFLERLERALTEAREGLHAVAVLFLDLDGFKVVNDSLGHPVGDDLLRAVGKRLLTHQRRSDFVARFGGDEFAILLGDLSDVADAVVVAERIISELRRFFSLGHRGFFINASIGVSFRASSSDRCTAEELIREADIALYRAKAAGKGRAVVFAERMGTEAIERLELQTDLQRALHRGELCLLYQPIVDLATHSVVGAEALVRWQHPQHGLLGPGSFIPMAEETGLILPLGQWVLAEACRQAAEWQKALPQGTPFSISVNLAARQLEQPNLVEQVRTILRDTGLEPTRLELELTETAVINHAESTIATIAALKALGIRLAIDDFGTGYSSLSYLQRLAVDTLKVDRSFTAVLDPDSSTAAVVQAVVMLAHALGMVATAEGIETAEQLSVLTSLGCNFGQGYYFSRPCSAVELGALLPCRTRVPALAAPPVASATN